MSSAEEEVSWEQALLDKGLQCPICIDVFCQPLRLGCGHAFCRLCLLRSTRLAPDGRRCPECRAVMDIRDPALHPADTTLEANVKQVVPAETLASREACESESMQAFLTRAQRHLPVFYMPGVASRCGELVNLEFFEPRYKILIRRALEGCGQFLCAQSRPRDGMDGLVVRVDGALFLPDGRAMIEGVGIDRVILRRVWVEEWTHGLYYAEIDGEMHARQDNSSAVDSFSEWRQPSTSNDISWGASMVSQYVFAPRVTSNSDETSSAANVGWVSNFTRRASGTNDMRTGPSEPVFEGATPGGIVDVPDLAPERRGADGDFSVQSRPLGLREAFEYVFGSASTSHRQYDSSEYISSVARLVTSGDDSTRSRGAAIASRQVVVPPASHQQRPFRRFRQRLRRPDLSSDISIPLRHPEVEPIMQTMESSPPSVPASRLQSRSRGGAHGSPRRHQLPPLGSPLDSPLGQGRPWSHTSRALHQPVLLARRQQAGTRFRRTHN